MHFAQSLCLLLSLLTGLGCSTPVAPADGGADMDASEPAPESDSGPVDDAALTTDTGPHDGGFTETRRALFVGNSYTFYNDLPEVVSQLAAASGVALMTEMIATGGAKFCDHFSDADLRDRIMSGDFDAVVFQGQSVDMFYDGESAYFCAQHLGWAARDAELDIAWFATWARREGNEFYSRGRGVTTPAEMTDFVEGFYHNIAEWSGAGGHVSRVGRAWERILAADPELELHAADGSHPTELGTLVAACTLAQALIGRTPELPTPAPFGVESGLARRLCDLATLEPCFDDDQFCGGECLSVAFDPMHCGECDSACPSPRECWRSTCECAPGSPLSATWPELTALDSACTGEGERPGVACAVAAHLACEDRPCGGSGFGPYLDEAGEPQVVCTAATVQRSDFAELAMHYPGCDGVVERGGDACRTAAHRACLTRGATAGFGPVAYLDGDVVEIACLERADVQFMPDRAVDAWGCEGYPERAWDEICNREVIQRRCGTYGGFGPIEPAERTEGVEIVCLGR